MIPGLNSSITHGGIEYHVQTEDLGRENPYLLTLVFRAGAIIGREKVNYREALGDGASEVRIKTLMDRQHQRVIEGVLAGRCQAPAADETSPQPPSPPAGSPPMPSPPSADKTLDRLIMEYLRSRNTGKRS